MSTLHLGKFRRTSPLVKFSNYIISICIHCFHFAYVVIVYFARMAYRMIFIPMHVEITASLIQCYYISHEFIKSNPTPFLRTSKPPFYQSPILPNKPPILLQHFIAITWQCSLIRVPGEHESGIILQTPLPFLWWVFTEMAYAIFMHCTMFMHMDTAIWVSTIITTQTNQHALPVRTPNLGNRTEKHPMSVVHQQMAIWPVRVLLGVFGTHFLDLTFSFFLNSLNFL